jgi:hypothetical protein
MFEEEIKQQVEMDIVLLPTMLVNGAPVQGALTVQNVFAAICASFENSSTPPPRKCEYCLDCGDLLECVSTGSCSNLMRPQDNHRHIKRVNVRETQLVGYGLPVNNYDDPLVGAGGVQDILFALAQDYSGVQMCGVDLGEIANNVGTAVAKYINDGSLATPDTSNSFLPAQCTGTEKDGFLASLDSFQSCSQWDIKELIETFPSALFGTFLRCANLIFGEDVTLSGLAALSQEDLDMCTRAILGDNPLGNALRNFYLYPDKTCPCLESLSDETPEQCTLDIWPIPLVGSWLKTSACLISSLGCKSFEDFCIRELEVLDKCLPAVDDVLSCQAVQQCNSAGDSLSLSLPPSLLGIPLPDACTRVYGEQKRQKFVGTFVTERYDIFKGTCTGDSNIWKLEQGAAAFGSTSGEPLLVKTGENRGTPGFLIGLVAGLGLAAIMAILVALSKRIRSKTQDGDARMYTFVELVETNERLT